MVTSTSFPRWTFSKMGPSFTSSDGMGVIDFTRFCHAATSSCGDASIGRSKVAAMRRNEPSAFTSTRNPFWYPWISSKRVAFEGRVWPTISVTMPMSSSAEAPVTVWSSPSSSIVRSHVRRSVVVRGSVAMCNLLVLFERAGERARAPSVIRYSETVLRRELDPHDLVAAQARRRMRAGAHERAGHVDQAIKPVPQERGDAQGALELVGIALRPLAHDHVLGPQDEERLRSGGEPFGQGAAQHAAERSQAVARRLALEEGRVADEVRDEARGRSRVEVPRRPFLHQAAVLHHRDAV